MARADRSDAQARKLADQTYRDVIYARILAQCFPDPDRASKCWLWHGKPGSDGLGRVSVAGRPYAVTRVMAWLLWNFPLDEPGFVCHRKCCKQRLCVNPDHLICFDSRAEGLSYLESIGRFRTGRGPKLTLERAQAIRLRASTMSLTALAHAEHVGIWAVRQVLANHTYRTTLETPSTAAVTGESLRC